MGCSGLADENGFVILRNTLFSYHGESKNVIIPDSVTRISTDVFFYCSDVASVTISDSVTTIDQDAFYGCSNLTSVTIPNSVTNIGLLAFSKCDALTKVYVDEGDTARVRQLLSSAGASVGSIEFVEPLVACTVTFDANGGTGGTKWNGYKGDKLGQYGKLPTPKRDGYAFVGWYTARTGGTMVTADTVVPGNVTYYARWALDEYTVTYRKYDGSGAIASETLRCGRTYPLAWLGSDLGWSRSGYVFAGWVPWNPDTEVRLCKYANGQPVKDLAKAGGTCNLWAVWSSPASYRICYHRCAGVDDTEKMDQVVLRNKEDYLAWIGSQIGWERKDYTFAGWTESENGPVKYKNGARVSNLAAAGGTKHLYAVWSADSGHRWQYKVRFNKFDGTGETRDATFRAGSVQRLPWIGLQLGWTRKGYDFAGWSTAKPDARPRLCKYANGQEVVDLAAKSGEVVGLWAVWKSPSAYSVCFHKNDGADLRMNQIFLKNETGNLAWLDSQIGWKRNGYVFKGWAESEKGAVKYANGAKVSNLAASGGTKHLYAIWGVAD